MKNDNLLFLNNGISSTKRFNIKKGMIEYRINNTNFDGMAINRIIQFVNAVQNKYTYINIPIHFILGNVVISDKLTYIMFECICNYLIETCKRDVYVTLSTKLEISTEGISSSPLHLLTTKQKWNIEKYKQKFKNDIYMCHYRKVVERQETEDPFYLSKLMSDVDSFLKPFFISKKCRDSISDVIVELSGNALEHAGGDCLIDLDVTESYSKEGTTDIFHGINIAIINFSNTLLGDSIAKKIKNKEILNDRHLILLDTYNTHKETLFSSKYLAEDFYNIAAFQRKISGRLTNETTGGIGLTTLISTLEELSDAYKCYVITGNRSVWFHHDLLSYNEDGWIGFNEEKEFLSTVPNPKTLGVSYINMPGTAYNLNFIMKKEECYNGK